MKNRRDWEKKGKKNACRICGQFIDNEEECYSVIIPHDYSHKSLNFIVHAHEWESFNEDISDISAIFEKLDVTVKPNTHNYTVPDLSRVKAFEAALTKMGCVTKKETTNRIYFVFPGRSTTFYFEKRFEFIDNTKIYNDMIETIFIMENVSRLEEEWKKGLSAMFEEISKTKKQTDIPIKYSDLIVLNVAV